MRFEHAIEVAADPARVWEVYADVERWHEWTDSITSVELLDGPLRVGARARVRQPRLPVAGWTVQQYDEGRVFVWTSGGPGLRTTGTHLVEPSGDGARATARLDQEGLLGGMVGRLTKGLTERYLAMEAAGLKARSEQA
jgi:carbon monoxide dehydrogenase subunit G